MIRMRRRTLRMSYTTRLQPTQLKLMMGAAVCLAGAR
jgi:hypothetical protein